MSFMQTTGRFHARSRPRCLRCLHAQHPSSSHASSRNSSKTLFLFTSLRILCRTHEAISEFGPVRHLHFHYRPLAFVRIKVTVLIASLVLIIASLKEQNKNKLINIGKRLVIMRGEGCLGVGEMGEESQLYGDGC